MWLKVWKGWRTNVFVVDARQWLIFILPMIYFRRLVETRWSKTACGSSAFLIWWSPGSRSCRPTSSLIQSSPVSVWRWLEPMSPGSTSTLLLMTGKMVVTHRSVTVDDDFGVFFIKVCMCVGLWTCYWVRCQWRNSERRRATACWKLLIKGWTHWIKPSWWSLCVGFCTLLDFSVWNRSGITVDIILSLGVKANVFTDV